MAIGPDIQDEHAPELTVTQARQGRRGKHMAWVLGISMALILVGFTSLWLVNAPRNAHEATQPLASSQTLQQTGDIAVQPQQPKPTDKGNSRPGMGADGRGL
jgi:hypothetical protein